MKSMKRYHIYWNDKILLKDLEEEEFHNVWSKMHWVYNKELNFIEVGEEIVGGSILLMNKRLRKNIRTYSPSRNGSILRICISY